MEAQKLISVVIAKLKIAYPYYFKDLTDEEFIGLVSMYQEELGDFNPTALLNAIKIIIRNNKYMPTLADIISEYKNSLKKYYFEIINNSDASNKGYLLDMVDWYSIHENFLEQLKEDTKLLENIKQIEYNRKNLIEYKEERDDNR